MNRSSTVGMPSSAPRRRSSESAAASPVRAGTSPRGVPRGSAPSSPTGTAAAPPSSSRRSPGPPLFFLTRFSAAFRFGRDSARLHQVRVVARVSAPLLPPSGFPRSAPSRGFTPTHERELQLPGHLRHGPFEAQARLTLLHVRPFAAASPAATTASADSSLRRLPASPFQA